MISFQFLAIYTSLQEHSRTLVVKRVQAVDVFVVFDYSEDILGLDSFI